MFSHMTYGLGNDSNEISERTNEREKPETFLRGETQLHLHSEAKAQPPTPRTIDKTQGNRHKAR